MKSRQVVRQVRRLKSFRRALKAFSGTGHPTKVELQRHQLEREWNVILSAKGFGSRWSSWILAFELVPFVPLSLPDWAVLDLCIDITEMHCNLLCRQEASARKDSFRHRIKVDHDEGFLSLSYRILRGKSTPPLNEVPYEVEAVASLTRSTKGLSFLPVHGDSHFRCNSNATFGDATVHLHEFSDGKIRFTVLSGTVPAKGILRQQCCAMTTGEIQDAFNTFWARHWLRDSEEETQSGASWQSFVDQMSQAGFPNFLIFTLTWNPCHFGSMLSVVSNLEKPMALMVGGMMRSKNCLSPVFVILLLSLLRGLALASRSPLWRLKLLN